MKKGSGKEVFVLWLSLIALICAVLSLHTSLQQLDNKEQD